uniref:Uncharacterized protein n=1 Tax=Anguilla anguilla TaxID=7936 RepID=A0A0E9SE36_ANGAN
MVKRNFKEILRPPNCHLWGNVTTI